MPLNLYGWSKHVIDRFIWNESKQKIHPPQCVGLKFFNVYGPNEYHKSGQTSVALKNFGEISDTGKAVLYRSHHPDYADGGQLRDFVYVRDCVDVVLWLLGHPDVSGIFNVGSGQARSFADLVTALYRAVGCEPTIDYIDMPDHLRAKYQYFTESQLDRLRAAGFAAPMTALEDGVADYVRHFLSQPDPYR